MLIGDVEALQRVECLLLPLDVVVEDVLEQRLPDPQ
jgi:hypothetical protein